ncbi:MAG: hypothetical protein DMG09_23655 [Acidobacteria bacterium]|nr:MAG: hypothetical protein DMG09_23655 [Acidobacteriota bacterium]
MIFPAKVALAFSLSCAPVCVLAARGHATMRPIAKRLVVRTEGRLLSAEEGITVLNAARGHQRQTASKPDCSHLVHEVYTLVGLEYRFARSNDLYQGAQSFERVARPQPGDLIVWRGHVGLVVDPEERTFYSSVRSGLKTESYYSRYWRQRGRPRFYRYRLEGDENSPVMAASLRADPFALPAIPDPAEDELATRAQPAGLVSKERVTVAPPSSLPQGTILISEDREPTREAIAQALIAHADGGGIAQGATLPGSFIAGGRTQGERKAGQRPRRVAFAGRSCW